MLNDLSRDAPVVRQEMFAAVVRDATYDARRDLSLRIFHSADELRVLLFLHARPSRAYAESFLRKKLGIRCTAELRRLAALGLAMETGTSSARFCYGVEHPQMLLVVDELSARYHAALALFDFFGAMAPGHRRLSRPRTAYRGFVAKPKQFVSKAQACLTRAQSWADSAEEHP